MLVTDRAFRRRTLALGGLAGANLAGGMLMNWYLLAVLGPGGDTDALFASLALPQVLLAIIASSFINVLVPLLSGDSDIVFRQKAWTFAGVTFAAFATLALVLAASAQIWVPLLAPGLPPPTRLLAIHLSRIQLVGMVCTSMAGVLTAVHRSRRHFYWVEVAPIIGTVVAGLVLVTCLPRYGVDAAAWAWLLRIGVNAVLLVPGLGRFAGFTRDRTAVTEAWRRIRPLVVGTAYLRTEPLFDRGLVSLAPPGDLSLYYLFQQVCYAVIQLMNNALIAPMAQSLALQVRHREWRAFMQLRRRSSTVVALLAVAGFGTLCGLAFAWSRGALSPILAPNAAAGRAMGIFLAFGGAFLAGPVAESLRSAFYSTGHTSTPVRLEAAIYTGGLAVKIAGFALFGVLGMASAASLQAVVGVILLHRVLSRFELRRETDSIR